MKQVKTERIAAAALTLFRQRGFTATKMTDIAAAAGMTAANLYVYFDSKLAILYEVYRPWLRARLAQLAVEIRAQPDPAQRLKRLLRGLWYDIPDADPDFANALIDGLAQAGSRDPTSNDFLTEVEYTVAALLRESLEAPPYDGERRIDDALLAHLIWMAFDGFVINRRLGDVRSIERIATLMTSLLLTCAATARTCGIRSDVPA